MPTLQVPGTPGTPIYAGRPTPAGGSLLTTLTLVNTSGSEQAANFVAPMFGQPFVQGDVPSGQYPAFELTDGTPCPATIHSVTTWPDGSMKWCGVLMRVPTTIAGSGSLTINVKNGGTAPVSSNRGLDDLTAADLSVVLTGVTNLTGEWTASLNTAINDGLQIVMIGDGPTGRIWRIRDNFKQSGSAHGQLVCWHYVAALQNSSGGLLGLRYLGRAAQPWTDVTSPSVARRVFTGALKAGATTLRTLQGIQSNESVGANITLPHYASFYTCGTDGRWDFVQGGGSASVDCTVRVVHDKTYFLKTRTVPPYDLSQPYNAPSSIDYYPMCSGGMVRATGGTGERSDIGVFPTWFVQHIIDPSAVTERRTRIAGLASGGWRTGLRQSTTGMPPVVVDIQPAYTGMGTSQPTWRYWSGGLAVGVSGIPEAFLWQEEFDGHHRPQASYFPYLLTGEPQFLDQLTEQAINFLAITPPSTDTTWKTTLPIMDDAKTGSFHSRTNIIDGVSYKGSGLMMRQDLARYAAWMLRDIGQLVGIYPDECPYGTAVKQCASDILDSNMDAFIAYKNAMPQSYRDGGLFNLRSVALGANDHPWCIGYMCNSFAHIYSITRKSNVLEVLNHFANFWVATHNTWDISCAVSIESYSWLPSGERSNSIEQTAFNIANFTMAYSAATNQVTKSGINSTFNVSNGDMFLAPASGISGVARDTRLYAVESTGTAWKLSLTPGGAPVDITSDVNFGPYNGIAVQDFSPRFAFEEYTGSEVYLASIRAAIRHIEAIGVSSVASVRAAIDDDFAASGISDFNVIPKNAMAAAYPG